MRFESTKSLLILKPDQFREQKTQQIQNHDFGSFDERIELLQQQTLQKISELKGQEVKFNLLANVEKKIEVLSISK